MYYVMIKSVAMALRGPVVGWGKLERKESAEGRTAVGKLVLNMALVRVQLALRCGRRGRTGRW